MRRSGIVYRRLWYVRRRNIGKFHMYIKIAAIMIILLLTVYYAGNSVLTFVQTSSKPEFKQLAVQTVYDARSVLETESIDSKHTEAALDGSGYIDLEKRVQEELCNRIGAMLKKRLASQRYKSVEIPLGAFTGIKALYEIGPGIQVMLDYEDIKVSTERKQDYNENGIPEEKLIVNVKTYVKAIMPLLHTGKPVMMAIEVDRVPDAAQY